MNFTELAKKRYSCRAISSKKVEREKIDAIIDSAILAPTAVNKQPFKIFLMDSEEAKKNICSITNCTFGADVFLVVGYKADDAWVREYDGHNFGEVDASIVATHMMLQITDLGLETTWVGHFNAPELKKLYPQMNDYELIAIFPVGYPEESAKPSERHFIRKEKEEILEIL